MRVGKYSAVCVKAKTKASYITGDLTFCCAKLSILVFRFILKASFVSLLYSTFPKLFSGVALHFMPVVLLLQGGVVVSIIASQHEGSIPGWGLSVWSLHVLSGYSGFLPPPKNMHVRLISVSNIVPRCECERPATGEHEPVYF